MRTNQLEMLIEKIIIKGFIVVAVVLIIFPVFWTFMTSIKIPRDIAVYPPLLIFEPTISNYIQIFREGVAAQLWTTFYVTIGATIITLVAGVPVGYALARFKSKYFHIIGFVIFSMRFVPIVAVLVPLLIIFRNFGLSGSPFGLIIAYQLFTLPVVVYIIWGFISKVSIDYEEAALIDGATRFQVFYRIILPIIKPGLLATVVLVLLLSWNQFTLPLILGTGDTPVISMGVMKYIGTVDMPGMWGPMSAWAIIATIPMIVIYLMLQKYLLMGLGKH